VDGARSACRTGDRLFGAVGAGYQVEPGSSAPFRASAWFGRGSGRRAQTSTGARSEARNAVMPTPCTWDLRSVSNGDCAVDFSSSGCHCCRTLIASSGTRSRGETVALAPLSGRPGPPAEMLEHCAVRSRPRIESILQVSPGCRAAQPDRGAGMDVLAARPGSSSACGHQCRSTGGFKPAGQPAALAPIPD